jgi:hypothetical protein
VATVFKGMQFDIGAPHQFLDFRYQVHSATEGEFWLAHCGALMDVEPMGDEFVEAMCHHIEDPTFDATAWATNPRAQMRPIHRPPRTPADRHPHCHWTVSIPGDAEPVPEPAAATAMAATRAASVVLGSHPDEGTGGCTDYRRDLDPDLRLEDFSAAFLRDAIDEICLQGHLLSTSFMAAVEQRFGTEAAVDIGDRQLVGIAGVVAGRLRAELGVGRDAAAVAAVLDAHPALRPAGYVERTVLLDGSGPDPVVELHLQPCPARDEAGRPTWIGLLCEGHDDALSSLVQAVDPTARVGAVDCDGGTLRWQVTFGHDPATERSEVLLTRFSTGADFVLR